jgi:serine/arginine repetitive matrix protein 2
MSTKTQNSTSFSRLSRVGLGLGSKSNSRVRESVRQPGADDEWYIPYNGPYEAPRQPLRRPKERDSWGDPVYGEDGDDDTALASRELQKLYGAGQGGEDGLGRFSGDGYGDQGRNSRPRDRTQSGVSGQTVSSGAVDPSRASFGTQRRSTVSSSQRPPVPSYINLDAAGGVGESPMPQNRLSREPSVLNRASIASIFTFGVPSRKPPSPKNYTDSTVSRFSRKLTRSGRPSSSVGPGDSRDPVASLHRRSSSSGSTHLRQGTVGRSRRTNLLPIDDRGSVVPSETDYYNSYYSTLISPGRGNSNPAQPPKPPAPSTSSISPTSPTQHPYAYVFPTGQPEGPQTAPILPSNTRSNGAAYNDPPRLTFTAASQPSNAGSAQLSLRRPFAKSLKSSVSTPDLRLASGSNKKLPPEPFPKGKDRWLSAETWCDALLFPRPRLKIKQDGAFGYVGSGRIVSPPGSPVQLSFSDSGRSQREVGMVSRVLAHSRSLVDLAKAAEASLEKPARPTPPMIPVVQTGLQPPQNGLPTAANLHPPRPKSFAQDDLALLSPVPSLTK